MTTQGSKLFFDPLITGTERGRKQDRGQGRQDAGAQPRGVQTAAELKALRAASLTAVSKDLERMLRERAR